MFSQQTNILHFSTQLPRSVLLRLALCSHHFLYTSGFQKPNWILLLALHSRCTTVTINYRFERIFFSMCVCCVCVCVHVCGHACACVYLCMCTGMHSPQHCVGAKEQHCVSVGACRPSCLRQGFLCLSRLCTPG